MESVPALQSKLPEHLDGDDGCVIVQSGAVGEGTNVSKEALSAGSGLQEVFFQAELAVLFYVGVGSFGDAVAVEHDAGARCELDLGLGVISGSQAEGQSYL